ncbi:hypothetical protein ACFQVA_00695 [Actinomadura keratinilytica]
MTETVTGSTRQGTDAALARYAVRLGDDALVLAQQLCRWITRALPSRRTWRSPTSRSTWSAMPGHC